MSTITVARRTIRREWTIFGTLLVLSVGLMGVSGTSTVRDVESGVNTALSPIEAVINNAADTAGSYFTAITQIDSLRTQNEKLRQENLTLKEQLDRMPAISKLSDDRCEHAGDEEAQDGRAADSRGDLDHRAVAAHGDPGQRPADRQYEREQEGGTRDRYGLVLPEVHVVEVDDVDDGYGEGRDHHGDRYGADDGGQRDQGQRDLQCQPVRVRSP